MEIWFEEHPIMVYVAVMILLTIIVTVGDIFYDFFYKKKRDWKDTGANILISIGKEIIGKTFIGTIGLVILYIVSNFIPWEIGMNIVTWIMSFILADVTYYWMHRIEHEHSILWALHGVHHSSESYNMSTANRLSWFEDLIEWIFLIPMVLMGFNVFQIIISLIFVVIYQHFLHTDKIKKLGFFEKIFNTPSHHRVHHGSNKKYINKNYSGVLIIWDKIFGTFQEEKEEVIYGLIKNIATYNPLWINTIEFKNIFNRVTKCQTTRDKIKMIFGPTGWEPMYFKKNKNEKNKRTTRSN